MSSSITELVIAAITQKQGIRRADIHETICRHRPDTNLRSITAVLNRHKIGGKLREDRTFFIKNGWKWMVDVEKANLWLLPAKERAAPVEPTSDGDYCFDLVAAAARAGVSVREVVDAIKTGALTADFVEEPMATYVIANADIDRTFMDKSV